MPERQQITHMQMRIARLATEKWGLSIAEVGRLFDEYQVFAYIQDCFGIFHVEGDEAVWEDIVPYLKKRGLRLCLNGSILCAFITDATVRFQNRICPAVPVTKTSVRVFTLPPRKSRRKASQR